MKRLLPVREKRFALSWIRTDGDRIVSSGAFAPQGLLIVLGVVTALGGALVILFARTYVVGIPIVVVGALHLVLRASFILDIDQRTWREELGIGPFVRRRTGSFDDALGVQLVFGGKGDSEGYVVLWRWKDDSRSAKALVFSCDYGVAYEKRVALCHELGLPMVEVSPDGLRVVPVESELTASLSCSRSWLGHRADIPPAPANVGARVERRPSCVILNLPRPKFRRTLLIAVPVVGVFGLLLLAMMILSHSVLMGGLCAVALVGVVIALRGLAWFLTAEVIELREGEMCIPGRLGVRWFRTMRIRYDEVAGIHRVPGYCDGTTKLILRTRKGSFTLGEELDEEGRTWLEGTLRRALGILQV